MEIATGTSSVSWTYRTLAKRRAVIEERRRSHGVQWGSTLAFLFVFVIAPHREAQAAALVAYTGATLIDGTGKDPITRATVIVRGDRIVKVGPAEAVAVPPEARRVNLAGKWMIPGLIDVHVHFFETGRLFTKVDVPRPKDNEAAHRDLDYQDLVPYSAEAEWAQARIPITLRGYLCAGVTTAASMGGPRFEADVREYSRHLTLAPRVLISVGPISTIPPEQLFPRFLGSQSTAFAGSAAQARVLVADGKRQGFDFIKLGRLGLPDEPDTAPIFQAAIEAAHQRHMRVFIHELELAHTKQAIREGVDVIAHIVASGDVDSELIALSKSRGTIYVTTATVYERQAAVESRRAAVELLPIERRCGDPQVIASWNQVLTSQTDEQAAITTEIWKRNLTALHRGEVTIAVGSDAGNVGLIHGASLHRELLRLQEIGMSPLQVLSAATINGARALGKERDLGSVESGKYADLVILNSNPLLNIGGAQDIAAVVRAGVFHDVHELLPPSQ